MLSIIIPFLVIVPSTFLEFSYFLSSYIEMQASKFHMNHEPHDFVLIIIYVFEFASISPIITAPTSETVVILKLFA